VNEAEHQDLIDIRALVDDYAIAMDGEDLDAFKRLFVPDGALIVRAPGRERPLGVFRGPGTDGVALVAKLLREHYESTLHNITTHRVRIDGDEARGWTYCLAYHVVGGDDGGALETLGVHYEEHFVRTPHGWRFNTRDATRLWSQTTATPKHPLVIDRAAAAAR
jgi:SnoaL-like protein